MSEAFDKYKAMKFYSDDRKYRYKLSRTFADESHKASEQGTVCFILLNPSTGKGQGEDTSSNDATVNKCITLAKNWRKKTTKPYFTALEIVNLYAFRATEKMMLIDSDSIGPKDDDYLRLVSQSEMTCIAAWGKVVGPQRVVDVLEIFKENNKLLNVLHDLRCDSFKFPHHPLYESGKDEYDAWKGIDSYITKKRKILKKYDAMMKESV